MKKKHPSTNVKSAGISFPLRILDTIDKERGDIPRSKYVLRILENAIQTTTRTKGRRWT